MALPALICFYIFRPWVENNGHKRKIGAFGAGFFSILLSSIIMALALWSVPRNRSDSIDRHETNVR